LRADSTPSALTECCILGWTGPILLHDQHRRSHEIGSHTLSAGCAAVCTDQFCKRGVSRLESDNKRPSHIDRQEITYRRRAVLNKANPRDWNRYHALSIRGDADITRCPYTGCLLNEKTGKHRKRHDARAQYQEPSFADPESKRARCKRTLRWLPVSQCCLRRHHPTWIRKARFLVLSSSVVSLAMFAARPDLNEDVQC
jgi:hypothetical protein